jgi:hypothetical protein
MVTFYSQFTMGVNEGLTFPLGVKGPSVDPSAFLEAK